MNNFGFVALIAAALVSTPAFGVGASSKAEIVFNKGRQTVILDSPRLIPTFQQAGWNRYSRLTELPMKLIGGNELLCNITDLGNQLTEKVPYFRVSCREPHPGLRFTLEDEGDAVQVPVIVDNMYAVGDQIEPLMRMAFKGPSVR